MMNCCVIKYYTPFHPICEVPNAQNIPRDLNRKTHRNIVSMLTAEVTTTVSPASSASQPICCAMVKELTAVGEANTPSSDTNAASRKPSSAPSPRNSPGNTMSFAATTAVSSRA